MKMYGSKHLPWHKPIIVMYKFPLQGRLVQIGRVREFSKGSWYDIDCTRTEVSMVFDDWVIV